jgi:hypothetical protein
MENTVLNNQEEVTNQLKGYISDNKMLLITIGFGTSMYLLGRQNGYCRGYKQSFVDMVITAAKS